MDGLLLDIRPWAEANFGAADLGDRRRTQRLVAVATQIAADPAASLPDQAETWADLKASYRLFDRPEVTFAAVAQPHWQRSRACGPGRYLVLDDTTELDFGRSRQITGLGPTGNGGGRGFLLHSGLLVAAVTEAVHGLAGQVLHYRRPVPKGETRTQRLKRKRESAVWGELIDQVGPPPPGAEWVHVMDRGADDFEVLCHCQQRHAGWVLRAKSLHRKALAPDSQETTVQAYLDTLPVAGTYRLPLRARPGQPARVATVEIRYGPLTLRPPKLQSPYLKGLPARPIGQWVVWVREVGAPKGVAPIAWVLYTSLPVTSLAEALEVVGYDERRWLIEEWHKALKTGCQVTSRQLKTHQRLEALVGVLGVEAVRLLQLKAQARTEPQRPAAGVVPGRLLVLLQRLRGDGAAAWTVGQFFRELAKLGGFLGRRGDGEPGWITLWRGWEKLHLMLRGAELATNSGA
jgi:Transposase DNA-binding/Transposase Tn5 dimerisation domain